MLVQPNADILAQNLEIISKKIAGIPKFCLGFTIGAGNQRCNSDKSLRILA